MGSRLLLGLAVTVLVGGRQPGTRESSSASPTADSVAPVVTALVPTAASLGAWTLADGPLTLRPDTLYEYLDGGAPRYLDYGFREAVHVRYAFGGDTQAAVTLDIYDMGSVLGAFGVYRSIRPPGVETRPWGAEGYRFENVAAAWRGAVYVHVEADDERPSLVGMAERLAADVAGRAPGPTAAPAILRPLPPEGRLPGSERYVARDLLGHTILPGGVLATYAVDGREAELYFSGLPEAGAAKAAVVRLRAHHAQGGATVRDVLSSGAPGFRHDHPTWGSGVVVAAGRYVAGVQGNAPDEAQRRPTTRQPGVFRYAGAVLKTLFLDAGGVLVHPNWPRVSDTLARHGVSLPPDALARADLQAKRAIDAPDPPKVASDAERGWLYFNLLPEKSGVARSAGWEHVPAEVVPALERLRGGGLKMVVVSNANGTVARMFERLELRRFFDHVFDSQVEGVEKPDPRFFELALAGSGSRPETTLHVGDVLPTAPATPRWPSSPRTSGRRSEPS